MIVKTYKKGRGQVAICVCDNCGVEFERAYSSVKGRAKHFCRKQCIEAAWDEKRKYTLHTLPSAKVSAETKGTEIVLINRFGLKNIPQGAFWKLGETLPNIFSAQKYIFPVVKTLIKNYSPEVVFAVLQSRKVTFLSNKYLGKYKWWCREEELLQNRIKESQLRYNRDSNDVPVDAEPVKDFETESKPTLKDWLDEL
jgi:hypothetical protein